MTEPTVCPYCHEEDTGDPWDHVCAPTEAPQTPKNGPVGDGDPQQAPLIPSTPPARRYADILLSSLPPSTDPMFAGRTLHPDSPFVQSVRDVGVLEPIIVVATDTPLNVLRLEDGRQRVIAARLAGLESVPAVVVTPMGWDVPGVLGLAAQEHRTDNIYADVQAVERMLDRGYSVEDIGDALHVRKQRVRYLLKFTLLHPMLRQGMGLGTVKRTVAEQAATLPADLQEALCATLNQHGRLTSADVHSVREAQRTEYAESIDLGLDLPMPVEDTDRETERAGTRHIYNRLVQSLSALSSAPADEDALAALITETVMGLIPAEADLQTLIEDQGETATTALALRAFTDASGTIKRMTRMKTPSQLTALHAAIHGLLAALALAAGRV